MLFICSLVLLNIQIKIYSCIVSSLIVSFTFQYYIFTTDVKAVDWVVNVCETGIFHGNTERRRWRQETWTKTKLEADEPVVKQSIMHSALAESVDGF